MHFLTSLPYNDIIAYSAEYVKAKEPKILEISKEIGSLVSLPSTVLPHVDNSMYELSVLQTSGCGVHIGSQQCHEDGPDQKGITDKVDETLA